MAVDIAAVLTASITDFKAKMADVDVSMRTMTASGGGAFSKMASVGKGALLGVGAVVAVVGAAAIDFGNKLEMSQVQLQAALKASGTSWASVSASVAQTGNAATKYGFTQAQIDSALTQGVISTQNYASAHRNLQIAIQLAAARHIDLASAMQAVDKAATGQLRPLKMLGIDLPVVASNALKVKQAHDALAASQLKALAILNQYPGALSTTSKHHAAYQTALDHVSQAQEHLSLVSNAHVQILDALSKRLSGQASAAANTFEGRIAAVKAQATNLVAQLGMKLIPVLVDVMNVVMKVVNWFEKHKTAAEALGIAVGTVLVAAIGAFVVSLFTAEGALAFLVGPIGIVVAAVAALTFVGIYLATHWQQVWSDIKTWVHDGQVWIQQHFLLIMAIPIIGWILYLAANWRTVWTDIQAVIQTAWSVIGPVFNFIKTVGIDVVSTAIKGLQVDWNAAWTVISGTVSTAWGVIKPVLDVINTVGLFVIDTAIKGLQTDWNAAWSAISGAVQTTWSIVKPIFDAINAAAGAVASAVNFITGSSSAATPNSGASNPGGTPHRAGGGPVSAFQPYLVGENGPEYFIPSASGNIVPQGAGFGGAPTSGGPANGGGSTVPVNLQLVLNDQVIGQVLVPIMQTAFLQAKRSQINLGLA